MQAQRDMHERLPGVYLLNWGDGESPRLVRHAGALLGGACSKLDAAAADHLRRPRCLFQRPDDVPAQARAASPQPILHRCAAARRLQRLVRQGASSQKMRGSSRSADGNSKSRHRRGSNVGVASSRITRTPSNAVDQSIVVTFPKSRDGTAPSERSAAWSR